MYLAIPRRREPVARRPGPRPAAWRARAGRLIRAVRDSDDAAVEQAVLRLSRSRRLFAPLAVGVGALVMLFDGVKLLVTNWRLTLIQVLPAMWIWLAMLDLKAHVLRGKSFHVVHGPVVVSLVLAVAAITAACFFLNAVFAFAIAKPGPPVIRPGVHPGPVQPRRGPGMGRRGRPVPRRVHGGARPLGVVVVRRLAEHRHRRDDGLLCRRAGPAHRREDHRIRNGTSSPSPPWAARSARWSAPRPMPWAASGCSCSAHGRCSSRASSSWLSALTLEAGATGAVKAVKMSAKLLPGRQQAPGDQALPGDASHREDGSRCPEQR